MLMRLPSGSPAEELEALTCVTHLYRLLLQRPPDRAGLRHHADRLLAGESLPGMVRSLLECDEAMPLWEGLDDGQLAWSLWRARRGPLDRRRGVAARLMERREFRQAWHAWQDDLDGFVAGLVRSGETRAAAILPSLFPRGIDPAEDDVYRAWSYRLWTAETERAIEAGIARSLPRLLRRGPPIELAIRLEAEDPANPVAVSIASLLAQSYGHWRLSLQGELPFGLAFADPRVVVGTDDVASPPDGAWLGWMQAGDTLSPAALALFVQAILSRPELILVYCDEDRIGPDGMRSIPVLKQGWDPIAAEQVDPVGGLALYRGDHLARRFGHERAGAGPLRDAHARLRAATDGVADRSVAHLPAVLFHRAGQARPGERAACAPPPSPGRQPPVSVVIATRDHAELLARCVGTLRGRTGYPSIEIVIVDNGSTEPDALALLDRLSATGCRVLRRPGPFNWSALNNDGVRASSGEVVVLMNNDVECVDPDWLGIMVSACLRPQAGVVGALLLFPDGAVQHAGIVIGPGPHAAHVATLRAAHWAATGAAGETVPQPAIESVAAVTGACMAFRREVFDMAGGLDAASLPVTWNDIDFCLRVRSTGRRVLLARCAVLVHDEGSTRTPDRDPENQERLARTRAVIARRHAAALRSDPFLNPQATVESGGGRLDPDAPRRLWRMLRAGQRARPDRYI